MLCDRVEKTTNAKKTKIGGVYSLVCKDCHKRKYETKKLLASLTEGCTIQNGWPCGNCFFTLNEYAKKGKLVNRDWQAIIFLRGDTNYTLLNNLPRPKQKYIWRAISKLNAIAEIRKVEE